MLNEIILKGVTIKYNLQFKRVKNINLRIKPDGTVWVSARPGVPKAVIEEFLTLKADFIIKALKSFSERQALPLKQYYNEQDLKTLVRSLCIGIYPYFEARGVKFPEIKFRSMVSQWGNCRSKKCVVTFNTNLKYAPFECIEYVVAHEFTHFLHPDHSPRFYNELSKIMPDWKQRRLWLKEISIR